VNLKQRELEHANSKAEETVKAVSEYRKNSLVLVEENDKLNIAIQ
jgi:hypothetical protein